MYRYKINQFSILRFEFFIICSSTLVYLSINYFRLLANHTYSFPYIFEQRKNDPLGCYVIRIEVTSDFLRSLAPAYLLVT